MNIFIAAIYVYNFKTNAFTKKIVFSAIINVVFKINLTIVFLNLFNIKISVFVADNKAVGVKYVMNGKLYSHKEICEKLFNMGIAELVQNAHNYGNYTDDDGNARYDI